MNSMYMARKSIKSCCTQAPLLYLRSLYLICSIILRRLGTPYTYIIRILYRKRFSHLSMKWSLAIDNQNPKYNPCIYRWYRSTFLGESNRNLICTCRISLWNKEGHLHCIENYLYSSTCKSPCLNGWVR